MYAFQVFHEGKLKPGIKAAYLEAFNLPRSVYISRNLRTWQGDFIIQGNPELDKLFTIRNTVRVICSFQIREDDNVAVLRVERRRPEHEVP